MTILLVEDDTKPDLQFTISDATGAAEDVSGAVVNFYLVKKTDDTLTNSGHTSCTLTDAANGVVTYQVQTSDYGTPGDYYGELSIVYSGGDIHTVYEVYDIRIRKKRR